MPHGEHVNFSHNIHVFQIHSNSKKIYPNVSFVSKTFQRAKNFEFSTATRQKTGNTRELGGEVSIR